MLQKNEIKVFLKVKTFLNWKNKDIFHIIDQVNLSTVPLVIRP